MNVIVDRIENKYLVCEKEDRTMIDINIAEAPKGVKPGDILTVTTDGIFIDKKATDDRRKEIEKLTKDIWDD
jgi:hypothetical protein